MTAVFAGLAPAVLAVVAQAVLRVGSRALSHPALVALAAAAFLALALFGGPFPTLTTQGLFFSGTALVTFGSAYAVLAYVAQRAVETYGWRTPNEMVRGLALSETTPGPLIMVVQFVAFLGAYHHPDPLSPWTAALMGALLTTWVTFVPCFCSSSWAPRMWSGCAATGACRLP